MQVKDIVHTTKYMKNGEEKKKYTNVGTLFVYDDGGLGIKLDSIPVNFDGSLQVYDRKPRQEQHGQFQQPQQQQQPVQQQMQRNTDYQQQRVQNNDELPF